MRRTRESTDDHYMHPPFEPAGTHRVRYTGVQEMKPNEYIHDDPTTTNNKGTPMIRIIDNNGLSTHVETADVDYDLFVKVTIERADQHAGGEAVLYLSREDARVLAAQLLAAAEKSYR